MSTKLIILGILYEKKFHGYEIKNKIQKTMGNFTSIAFGSIYFALAKLSEERLIEKTNVEKAGKRPSRNIYKITDAGKQKFIYLLENALKNTNKQYFTIDSALTFLSKLPGKKIEILLEKRIKTEKQILNNLIKHRNTVVLNKNKPNLTGLLTEHSIIHHKAELYWLNKIKLYLQTN